MDIQTLVDERRAGRIKTSRGRREHQHLKVARQDDITQRQLVSPLPQPRNGLGYCPGPLRKLPINRASEIDDGSGKIVVDRPSAAKSEYACVRAPLPQHLKSPDQIRVA